MCSYLRLTDSGLRQCTELADFNTAARENDEVREGRTRAQTRAVNQQSVSGLVATLGLISASELMYTLLAEQRAGDAVELPKERMLSQSLVAIKKPGNRSTQRFGTEPCLQKLKA